MLVLAIMSDMAEGVVIGIVGLIAGALLGWTGNKLRKKWFFKYEELCDLLFINTDKIGNTFYRKSLNIAPNNDSQNIPIYLRTNNTKTISGLTIRFGVKKTCFKIFWTILITRLMQKRLFTAPSPYWWIDIRTPMLETKIYQPKVKQLIGIFLIDNKGIAQPVIIEQSFFYKDEYHIVFNDPIEIPIGFPLGRTIQTNLELEAVSEWKGIVKLSSNVNGSELFVIKKVNISYKNKVSKT